MLLSHSTRSARIRAAGLCCAIFVGACGRGSDPTQPVGPGAPASVAPTGPVAASGTAGGTLTGPFGVTVRDAKGLAVPNVAVSCTVESGGGSIASPATSTSSTGAAECGTWTLGGAVGTQRLTVAIAGLTPVQYQATVVAGAASALVLSAPMPSIIQSGVALTSSPRVRVLDRFGNPTLQAGVVLTATVSGATLAGATATTDATGEATFDALVIRGAVGARTISFTLPASTTPTTANFALVAGRAAALSFATTLPATLRSGVTVVQAPALQLEDDAGNAVAEAGVSVTLSVNSATVVGGTAITDATGRARFATFTVSGLVGPRLATISAGALTTPAPAAFSLGAGEASALVVERDVPTTLVSGFTASVAPIVRLRDAAGNPVAAAGVAVRAVTTTLGLTLRNATAATNVDGRAQFTDLGILGNAGAIALRFESTGLNSVASSGSQLVLPSAQQIPSSVSFGPDALPLILDPTQARAPTVVVRNASGDTLRGALVDLLTRETAIATVSGMLVTGRRTGRTTLVAQAVAAPSVVDSIATHVTLSANAPIIYTDMTAWRLTLNSVVTVRVFIDGRGAGALSGAALNLTYPRRFPTQLRLDNAVAGAGAVVNSSSFVGLVSSTWASSAGTTGPVLLATLTFTVVGGAGEPGQLILNPFDVVTPSLVPITATVSSINPSFTVVTPP